MLLFLLTMMLPEEVIAIPLVAGARRPAPAGGLNLADASLGVILPVGAWGFSILVMTEFMKDIPTEIEEAARLDGVGEFRMLLASSCRCASPALGVIGVFGFMMIWDQYLLPLLVAADDPTTTRSPWRCPSCAQDPEVGTGVVLAASTLAMVPL